MGAWMCSGLDSVDMEKCIDRVGPAVSPTGATGWIQGFNVMSMTSPLLARLTYSTSPTWRTSDNCA